jgi:hypothetical protein
MPSRAENGPQGPDLQSRAFSDRHWDKPRLRFLSVVVTLVVASASVSACATSTPPSWAPPLVDEIKRASYAELAHEPLRVGLEEEPFVGGRALFAPWSSLVAGGARDYEVRFNEAVVDDDTRRYVTAHELAHIVDYHARDAAGLWRFVAEIAVTPWVSERRADVIVVDKGYVNELVAYRKWQREWMKNAPDALAARKQNYFTPNEARAADDVRRRCPDVFRTFREHPPRNIREILRRCP